MKDYGLTEVRAYDLNPERMYEALKACDNKITISDNLEKSVENAEVLFICVPTSYHIDTYNEINKLGNFPYLLKNRFHIILMDVMSYYSIKQDLESIVSLGIYLD